MRPTIFFALALWLTTALWLTAVASTAPALADEVAPPPTPTIPAHLVIEAPDGWDPLPGLSRTISQSASESDFFGKAEAFQSGALAYGRANRGALYLTWADSVRTQPGPEASIRHAFDELHQAPYLASPEAGSTQEVAYRERSFDGVAEMRFEWAHLSNGTVNIVRALGWRDADARVHMAVSECVLQSESIGESRPLCESAIDSLRLADASAHTPLASLPAPGEVGAPAPADFEVPKLTTGDELSTDSIGAAPQQRGEVLYQGRPKTKGDDNNRFIIGIGLLLLATAFWLTTRSSPSEGNDSEEGDEGNEGNEGNEGKHSDENQEEPSDAGSSNETQSDATDEDKEQA